MIFKLGIFISLISNIVFGLPVRELQLGSQRDIHNCVTDGGYQWCESSQECIRPWLTECPIQTNICKDSRQQLCRMLCPRPVCKSNECAMRIDTCCHYKCIDSNKNNLQINDICYRFCEENPEKNAFRNSVSCDFVFASVLGGFGEDLGGSREHSGKIFDGILAHRICLEKNLVSTISLVR